MTVLQKVIYGGIILVVAGSTFVAYKWKQVDGEKLCFYNHLTEAISKNEQRQLYYASQTNGLSRVVSEKLIKSEKRTKILALMVDLRAQSFLAKGVPIVCDDFIGMDKVRGQERQLNYTNEASESIFKELEIKLAKTRVVIQKNILKDNFKEVADLTWFLLGELEQIEKKTESNFCMTRHVIESLGFAALHIEKYSEDTKGAVNELARFFLKQQVRGFSRSVLEIDRGAQKVHKEVGIICNDIPDIPFREEYTIKIKKY